MARGKGEGYLPKKPRKDGLWAGKWTDRRGKRHSVYGRSRTELRAKMEDAKRLDVAGRRRGTETVAEYLERWLADVIEPHREYRTVVMRRGIIHNHLIPAIGMIRLDALTVADVRTLLNRLLGTRAPGTINQIRATLVAALNEAINEDLVERNVAARVPKVRDPPHHRPPLSSAEAQRFLDAVARDRLEALYRVVLACGLRIGEALGLTWDRVNLTTGVTRIDQQLQRQPGTFVLKDLKNAASIRTITLPAFARDALHAHRLRQQIEQEHIVPWENAWGLVFTGPKGQPLYVEYVRRDFGRYLRDAGLPQGSPHDLRHVAASLLAAQGVAEIEVQALLGHASARFTRAVYLHAYPEGRQRVADAMDGLFSTPSDEQKGQ